MTYSNRYLVDDSNLSRYFDEVCSVSQTDRWTNQLNDLEKHALSFELRAVDCPSILKEVLGCIENNFSFNEERLRLW